MLFRSAQSPIFTKEFKDSIKDRHFEVSALRIGIKLESESMVFYRTFSEQVSDPKVKEFLLHLSSWEAEHYKQLKTQVGYLEEFYLTKNSDFRF